jgi:superfamily II DNA or RNA helicase
MSIKVDTSKISPETLSSIRKDLLIRVEPKIGFAGVVSYITPYIIFKTDNVLETEENGKEEVESVEELIIPFAYAKEKKYGAVPERSSYRQVTRERNRFAGVLRDKQKEVSNIAKQILSKTGSVLVSAPCGYGKTVTSLYLTTKICLPNLIIVHNVVLLNQWVQEINRFCPNAKLSIITGKTTHLDPDCDFYVMNAINGRNKQFGFFDCIGLVIIDECHRIMAEVSFQCLQYIFPRYIIGLSATPYRDDSLDILIEFYFGKRNKSTLVGQEEARERPQPSQQIEFKLNREHLVYMVKTGFKPVVEKTKQGRVNWGKILDSQANDVARNNLICDLVTSHKDRIFLILVKRVNQGNVLKQILESTGESVTTLLGSQQKYDENARILIGTSQKIGTGFDHKRLNALVLAGDVDAYFIQYLGRVFRTEDVVPIVFDLVDEYSILKKHYSSRRSVYLECNGKIITYGGRTSSKKK